MANPTPRGCPTGLGGAAEAPDTSSSRRVELLPPRDVAQLATPRPRTSVVGQLPVDAATRRSGGSGGAIERRSLLTLGVAMGASLLANCTHREATEGAQPVRGEQAASPAVEASPVEDLMGDHGVLERLLLVYEDANRRLSSQAQTDLVELLSNSATLMKRFAHDYHEKLEEDWVFPRFEKARTQQQLVGTLRRQHLAGRTLTEEIQRHSTGLLLSSADARTALSALVQSFVRMYRPHHAREDSVLLPAFRQLVDPKEFAELGERFHTLERQSFGRDGRASVVRQVEALEQQLHLGDLETVTPA